MSVNTNQTSANKTTSFFAPASGGGGGGSNFPTGITVGTSNSGGTVWQTSSFTSVLTTTASNYDWAAGEFSLQPVSNTQGGNVRMRLTYDPLDAGQTALEFGAGDVAGGDAYIGAVWANYIAMPLKIWGATITMYSDNETFMFLDGKAGAIGSISTGVAFSSSESAFSSITASPVGDTANLSALFSTLKTQYPACFQ